MIDKKMEAAVVGAIIGPTIRVVLQKVLTFSVEETSHVLGFEKDLQRLKESFSMIQNFLSDAEAQQITNKAVKRWLKNLEAVAFDADNVFDAINYKLLQQKVETQNQMKKKKVLSFLSGPNSITSRQKMGKKIRDINKRLETFNQEASGFGLQKGVFVGSNAPTAPVRQQTDSFALDPIVIGRDADVSKIVKMLLTCPVEEFFSVIPIVGMGGLGKTTLARLVFNDPHINNSLFKKKIWVCVSENFDPTTLFKMILESLTARSVRVGSREAVLKKLRQNLEGERYLLVLDDVWNEDNDKWEDFVNSLSGITSVKGNCIIVTARSKRVASIARTLPIHELSGLSDDNCWSIIKAKSFKGKDVPSEFQEVGKGIAQRCQGLPLVAKVIGGLLLDKLKEEWLSILENWLSEFGGDENTVLKILKLSFDHLPSSSLKKCFAYCSIFPKDTVIEKQNLIELWMAEGFLQTNQGNDMETIGNNFFELLVQNSLFQDVVRYEYGNVTYCKMHDLFHDLACYVLDYRTSSVENSGSSGISLVPYLNMSGDEPYEISKEQGRYLRTFFFSGKESNNKFLNLKCLRVLTLKGKHIKELPNRMDKMKHMRYLDISETEINSLPDSIGKLYNLQTLRIPKVYGKFYFSKQPNILKNLMSLRHLHLHPETLLPPEVGQLTSLQTLKYFAVGHEKGHQIGELGNLKNLRGTLNIYNLGKVNDIDEAKSADLFWKPNIFKLKFSWFGSRAGSEINDEKVLEGLQPHPNLKLLDICGFNGRKFPLWTMKMIVCDGLEGHYLRLNNLLRVSLQSCENCEEIPMLGNLPYLDSIELNDLTNVRCIGPSFYSIDNCCSSSRGAFQEIITLFPALKKLELSRMPNLTKWVEAQGDRLVVFPCLEELVVRNCQQLRSGPSHFPSLKILRINGVDSDLPLEHILSSNINLTHLELYSCPNITHLVLHLRGNGSSLKKLQLKDCTSLRELPYDVHSLLSLETLHIDNCPNLMAIPYPKGQLQGLSCLRQLFIRNCQGLSSLPSEMLESSVSLHSLEVSECPNMTSFPVDLRKMPRLTYLGIFNCPKLSSLPKGVCSLSWLTNLNIGPFEAELGFNSLSESLQDIQGLHSLRQLVLFGWPHWKSLPDQFQHITTLTYLGVYHFGIEALPEWFENFTSLQCLSLYNCNVLRYLPSNNAIQRLSKLERLDIGECPMIEDYSEWSKISHIPQIYVDGIQRGRCLYS